MDFGFELQYLAVFFAAALLAQAVLFFTWLAAKGVKRAISARRGKEGGTQGLPPGAAASG